MNVIQRHHQLLLAEEAQDDAVVAALLLWANKEKKALRRRRRWWSRPWITRRPSMGQYETLFGELERESHGDFQSYMRMSKDDFYDLLVRITPKISKSQSARTPLEPGLKLAVTLRYLATGNSFKSLEFSFRVAKNTISLFIPEVCEVIYDELHGEFLQFPQTSEEWKEIANGFTERWNYHHCLGAIDGKHIAIRNPPHSGSLYYNYKGFYSIVLLAVVDSYYRFIWTSIGANGSASDCGIFNRSSLSRGIEENTLNFPMPEPLPGEEREVPYFFVGDDAFPLRQWMMKPYSKRQMSREERIFNYRTSRARRVVENAFGILAHVWRVLLSTMALQPHKCIKVVQACVALHNYLRTTAPSLGNRLADIEDSEGNVEPGVWRTTDNPLTNAGNISGPRALSEAKELREYLSTYYNSPLGSVPWQDDVVDN